MAAGLNAAPVRADTVVCESRDGQTNHCSADTRGGVRLVTQYSKHGCYQGDSWGYDRRSIWVSNGCRARFETGAASSEQSDQHNHKHAAAAAAVALGILGAVALANRHTTITITATSRLPTTVTATRPSKWCAASPAATTINIARPASAVAGSRSSANCPVRPAASIPVGATTGTASG